MLRADQRQATDGAKPATPNCARLARAGLYLTDETFLYRIVRLDANGAGEMIELEDCYRLDVVRVPLDDLLERRLRVITLPWFSRWR